MQHRVRVYLDEASRFQAGESAEMAAVVTHPTSISAGDVRAVILGMRNKYGSDFKASQVERVDMIRLAALIRAKGWLVFFYRLLPSEAVTITRFLGDALTELDQQRQKGRAPHPLANLDFQVLATLNQPVSEPTDRWYALLWLLMKDRNSEGRCLLGDWVMDRRSDINEGVVQHLLMLSFVGFAPREDIEEILRRVRVSGVGDFYRVTSSSAEEDGGEGLVIADYCAKFFRQAHVQYATRDDTNGFQMFMDILNMPNMAGAVLAAETDIPYWVENCAVVWEQFISDGLEAARQRFSTHPYRHGVFDWMVANGFFQGPTVRPPAS